MSANLSSKIMVVKSDITKQQVDAIVNAANNSLLGGGGVDGAIHRAAGPQLVAECRKLNGCSTGEAKITKGYQLPAKWVIHTVGPIWEGGNRQEEQLLANCYHNCLELALKHNIQSLAFPAISTGIYGFPLELATKIAVTEVKHFLATTEAIKEIIFVCFSDESLECYQRNVTEIIAP